MKNKTLPLLAIVILAACTEKKQGTTPPEKTVEAFKTLHPKAVIEKWNDEPPIWEAKYSEGSEKGAVSFDQKNDVTETELVLSENALPNLEAIKGYITANYPKERILRCEKIVKTAGDTTYEIQITGKELIFDTAGNFIAEEPD
ncbi:hypothetical protein [Dyadobacter psychrophilus]|uniref:Beta-lactamase-inhibitor-like, PepSY-like n=1 Tax=Dyadobacter psychrophilus TaxID=651661 RepID=A0A1T5HGJ1_9BACT|nr:hypothetical protein [Dyadobacter psychrophilus]SKC19690.1 hypothetical protein SAMN05660293_05523 [Dyadobacter psychrophilus]